ncbi:hypothetical protein FGO68_gene6695 [Halteria grandinella]|uniref:Uncharacterized protein n=1 Tax=Halteria grandinella TaxID=5974 RepID=A0A8J8P5B7_HALGN|nr:hypothetical protein FGO68_gene6695 [Halteria grandinella]
MFQIANYKQVMPYNIHIQREEITYICMCSRQSEVLQSIHLSGNLEGNTLDQQMVFRDLLQAKLISLKIGLQMNEIDQLAQIQTIDSLNDGLTRNQYPERARTAENV